MTVCISSNGILKVYKKFISQKNVETVSVFITLLPTWTWFLRPFIYLDSTPQSSHFSSISRSTLFPFITSWTRFSVIAVTFVSLGVNFHVLFYGAINMGLWIHFLHCRCSTLSILFTFLFMSLRVAVILVPVIT